MIDTEDLSSYYPGYDEYCEPREQNQGDEEDIDAIIDERRLQEMEQVKEIEILKVIYKQNIEKPIFDIVTYHNEFLETICKQDKSTFIAIKQSVIQSFDNIERKVKEEQK